MAGLEEESARFRTVAIQVDHDSMHYNTKKLYNPFYLIGPIIYLIKSKFSKPYV